MRVVVTGAGNAYGQAIVDALVEAEHMVRLFGVSADVAARWGDKVQWHPGDLATIGSIEPVLAERQVLIHAANLDEAGKDKEAHARFLDRGTLGCRYGAERELVDQFVFLTPAEPGRTYGKVHAHTLEIAQACRVHTDIIRAGHPEQAAQATMDALNAVEHLGRYPGRETDAWAA